MFSIRKLGAIGRTYRHLNRYHQILRVLFKYGFADLVDRLHIDQYLESGLQMINRKPRDQLGRLSRAERLRLVFEELGPTFIKLGQLLSSRPDLVPAEFSVELAKLQDDIPPVGEDEIRAIFQEELGRPPEEIFDLFDAEPLAAASIGQVHRARLDSGERVVVKVQRPGIVRSIAVDLEILAHIASLMEEYLEEAQGHQPMAIVDEFARSLSREIDFTSELTNIQRFARHFAGNEAIHVPAVYPSLCTERILVMECVEGIKASLVGPLREQGYDLSLIAERGATLMMEQIFVHGFFHADPHPGNVFVLPENVVCFIDFGQMGRLSLKEREDFTDLVMDLVEGDEQRVVDGVLKVTNQLGEVDRAGLARDLVDLMDRYLYRPLEEMKAEKVLEDLLDLVSRHQLSFKPSFYLMMKSLSTVEGLGLMLDPSLELVRLAKPFMRRIRLDRMRPERLGGELMETGSAYLRLFRALPGEMGSILAQLRGGRMRMEFEHKGLRSLETTLERVASRIAFAIVLASLVVGSALIILSNIPPYWHGIPAIGLVGFLASGLVGCWQLLTIIRRNRR
ncbi:MAG: ABC1 kinase family protein [Desulfobulbus sp.]|jgi:ubiquinone biosynthesis protein